MAGDRNFNFWVMHPFLEFSKIGTWNMKFRIRSSIYIVNFLIQYN